MDLTKVGGEGWQQPNYKKKLVITNVNEQFSCKTDPVADFLKDAKTYKNSTAVNEVLTTKRSKKVRQFVSF